MTKHSKPVRDWDRVIVRLPDGMKEKLEDQAAQNCRALNGEIIFLLMQGLPETKTASERA